MPKYPNVEVDLSNTDGNAFSIMGAVRKAMRRANCDKKEIDAFLDEATSGDYDNLLKVVYETVEVV